MYAKGLEDYKQQLDDKENIIVARGIRKFLKIVAKAMESLGRWKGNEKFH